jgi:hypothetical protein
MIIKGGGIYNYHWVKYSLKSRPCSQLHDWVSGKLMHLITTNCQQRQKHAQSFLRALRDTVQWTAAAAAILKSPSDPWRCPVGQLRGISEKEQNCEASPWPGPARCLNCRDRSSTARPPSASEVSFRLDVLVTARRTRFQLK